VPPRRRWTSALRTPAVIAHRGSSARFRENTMEAFRAAADEGADMSELDVWSSRDGIVMVHHDEEVGAARAPIGALTRAELAGDPATAHIPTLETVLAWARERTGIYVELKGPGTAEPVARLVRQQAMADRVVIGSFDPSLVAAVRAADRGLLTSILYHPVDVDALIGLGRDLDADYIHPCWKRAATRPHALLGPEVVERSHAAGFGVVTWDEDRPDELAALFAAGADAVSTNMPALAVALRERGRAPGDGA
jgi:glycerophosphoryl diester phosphodiesterase